MLPVMRAYMPAKRGAHRVAELITPNNIQLIELLESRPFGQYQRHCIAAKQHPQPNWSEEDEAAINELFADLTVV